MIKTYTISEIDRVMLLDSMSSLRSKITAVSHVGAKLYVHTTGILTIEEETQLDNIISSHDVNSVASASVQKTRDLDRFTKRAEVKNQILAEMAAENMERVRAGIWTVGELISLTTDPELKSILDDINTLSFEIAYSKVDALTNNLVTDGIKSEWKVKLYTHFYA